MIVRDQGRFTVYWRGSGRVPFLRGPLRLPLVLLDPSENGRLELLSSRHCSGFSQRIATRRGSQSQPAFRALLVRRPDSFAGFLQSAALAPGGRGLLCFDRSAKRVHEVLVYGSVSQFMTGTGRSNMVS